MGWRHETRNVITGCGGEVTGKGKRFKGSKKEKERVCDVTKAEKRAKKQE